MITESVISAIFGAMSGFLRTMIDTVLGLLGQPNFSVAIPTPFWFVIEYLIQVITVVYPVALGWWVWRQVKA